MLPTWSSQIPQFYEDTLGAKKAAKGLSLPSLSDEKKTGSRGTTVRLTDEDFDRQRAAVSSRRKVLDSLSEAQSRDRQDQQPHRSKEKYAAQTTSGPDSSLTRSYDELIQRLRLQQGMERIETRYKGF